MTSGGLNGTEEEHRADIPGNSVEGEQAVVESKVYPCTEECRGISLDAGGKEKEVGFSN